MTKAFDELDSTFQNTVGSGVIAIIVELFLVSEIALAFNGRNSFGFGCTINISAIHPNKYFLAGTNDKASITH